MGSEMCIRGRRESPPGRTADLSDQRLGVAALALLAERRRQLGDLSVGAAAGGCGGGLPQRLELA